MANLYFETERENEAVPLWEELIQMNPAKESYFGGLILTHFAIEEVAQAEQVRHRALSGTHLSATGKAYIQCVTGYLSAALGDFRECEKRWRDAVRLDPNQSAMIIKHWESADLPRSEKREVSAVEKFIRELKACIT